jgi:riboflavin kinase/FMN adenylyltransferase
MRHIITGTVVKGDQYGRRLGFPTANLDKGAYTRATTQPSEGVYAGWATIQSVRHPAAIIIHQRPSHLSTTVEAHLLSFTKDIYHTPLTLVIEHFVRPFQEYPNEERLRAAIQKDLVIIKEYLGVTEF